MTHMLYSCNYCGLDQIQKGLELRAHFSHFRFQLLQSHVPQTIPSQMGRHNILQSN